MRQTMALRNVVDVGSRADRTARQARVGNYANLRTKTRSAIGFTSQPGASPDRARRPCSSSSERRNQCDIDH
jgi:hypothetical protein